MSKKVAILRGINVGGKRKILMNDLKALCENLGWRDVTSYIQSGNLVFNLDEQDFELEKALEEAIAEKYGFEVPVIVQQSEILHSLIEKNPFFDKNADIDHLHLCFLKEKPAEENINKILTHNSDADQYEINEKAVFIYCEGKYHQSKLTNNFFEKKLKVGATTRNWKTVLKLLELSSN